MPPVAPSPQWETTSSLEGLLSPLLKCCLFKYISGETKQKILSVEIKMYELHAFSGQKQEKKWYSYLTKLLYGAYVELAYYNK